MIYNYGDKVTARFEPKRLDTLRPQLKHLIGQTFVWRFNGWMEEGTYKDQVTWLHNDYPNDPFEGYWIPDEDLIKVES